MVGCPDIQTGPDFEIRYSADRSMASVTCRGISGSVTSDLGSDGVQQQHQQARTTVGSWRLACSDRGWHGYIGNCSAVAAAAASASVASTSTGGGPSSGNPSAGKFIKQVVQLLYKNVHILHCSIVIKSPKYIWGGKAQRTDMGGSPASLSGLSFSSAETTIQATFSLLLVYDWKPMLISAKLLDKAIKHSLRVCQFQVQKPSEVSISAGVRVKWKLTKYLYQIRVWVVQRLHAPSLLGRALLFKWRFWCHLLNTPSAATER